MSKRHLAISMLALGLVSVAYGDQYFRLKVTANSGDDSGACQMSRFALYDADGNIVSDGLTNVVSGTAAADLPEGAFCTALDYNTPTATDIAANIFVNSNSKWYVNNVNGGPGNSDVGDGTYTLTLHLPAETAVVTAYNFRSGSDDASNNRSLSSWTIEESYDGVEWKTVSTVSDFPDVTANNAFYNNGVAFDTEPMVWTASGFIECSITNFTSAVEGTGYLYTFTNSCTVRATTNVHFTASYTSAESETDLGYFSAGETIKLKAPSGGMVGLTAVVAELEDIPSASVTPDGGYGKTQDGAYTIYTFIGDGSITVDKPGVIALEIVGPGGGEQMSIPRLIANEGATITVSSEICSYGSYSCSTGTTTDAGYVRVSVWDEYALYLDSIDVCEAGLNWGVTAIDDTADIRLQYGSSAKSLDNTIMLAADAEAGVGGTAEITGLDPETTYYAQLYVDSGSGYVAVGEVVSFTTESLLSEVTGGREISAGDPPVPGLNSGYSNKRNAKMSTTDSSIVWIENQLGIIAVTNNQDNGGKTTFPPIWANNRTWVFHGYMYFDGEHYYKFGESIDDDSVLIIDGKTLIDDSNWSNFITAVVKPEEGWHSVEFRFANGTGGAGLYNNIKDKNGNPCGFGYGISTSSSAPGSMAELEWLCDPGDGSLLRAEPPSTRTVSIEGFEIDQTQYSITISNWMSQVVSVELYYGESTDIDVLTNAETQLYVAIDMAAYETAAVEIQWESETPPNYVVIFPGVGVSDVSSLTAGSRVAAAVKSVGSDSAVITTGVGFDLTLSGDAPSVELTAYYGSSDGGTTASAWASSQTIGTDVEAGVYDFTISGLELGKTYVARIAATDAGSNVVWSDPITFSTSGVYLGDTLEVYENDPREQTLTVHRAGTASDLAKAVTVFLEYSGNGVSSVSTLPGSATFAAGETSATVSFTPVDNSSTDGDRTFTATLIAGSSYTVISPTTSTVTVVDDESAEGEELIWTNTSGDSKWETAGNWDKGFVPRSIDTVVFTDTGLTEDGMGGLALSGAAGIRAMRIETAYGFMITGKGSLAVNTVTRIDTDGAEEGAVIIAVPVIIGNSENNYSRWNVAGSNGIVFYSSLTSADGIKFFKEGDGGIWLFAADTEYVGPWYIYEGAVYAQAKNSIAGSATIGTGDIAAALVGAWDNSIAAPFAPTVGANGSYVSKAHGNETTVSERVTVAEGGVADLGDSYSAHQAYLTGASITNGVMYSREQTNQKIVSYASSVTSVFGCDYRIGAAANPLDVTVEDGAAAIDLAIDGRIYYGDDALSTQYFTKFGNGTLRTTADWTGMSLGVEIAAGRILVDNPSADGLGNQAIKVDAGASLGGTGFIGGTTATYDTSSAISVAGEGNNEGEIAPGTIDDDGNHVIGTLTVGSTTKEGSVSFADYTLFTAHIGPDGTSDLLDVYGTVTIAEGAGTKLAIVCDDTSSIRGGSHVLMKATGGITGTFHGVTVPHPSWKVVYTDTTISVELPPPGHKVIIR